MGTEKLIENIRSFFGRKTHSCAGRDVLAVYLFGSQARGSAASASDIDIGILLGAEPTLDLSGIGQNLASELEAAVRKEVDLIVLNNAPADLVHRVLRDGVLVLDRDPSFRIRFEVRKRNEYSDLLPVLREYRRQKRDAA